MNNLREAMIYRSVFVRFCVEAFSLERLRKLAMDEIAKRYETFKLMRPFDSQLFAFYPTREARGACRCVSLRRDCQSRRSQ